VKCVHGVVKLTLACKRHDSITTTGKNRPLEQDEVDFLEAVADTAAARQREQAARKRATAAIAAAAAAADASEPRANDAANSTQAAGSLPRPLQAPAVACRPPPIRAVIKPKAKASGGGTGISGGGAAAKSTEVRSHAAGLDDGVPNAKKQRIDGVQACLPMGASTEDGGGLASLLGRYGSDSGDD
jgi:hypothetical protein